MHECKQQKEKRKEVSCCPTFRSNLTECICLLDILPPLYYHAMYMFDVEVECDQAPTA